MKRSIVVFMICLFVLCAASVAFAAERRTSGPFTYEIKGNGTAVITEYNWKKHSSGSRYISGDLFVPNMLDGFTVTGIGDRAFVVRRSFFKEGVEGGNIAAKIPESIVSIGEQAFFECDFIKTINIPASVKIIGDGAFAGTDMICNVDAQNDTFTTIENVLYNKKDRELMFFPDGIAKNNNFEIPNGIESIGKYAFYDADEHYSKGLAIVFPNTLRHIKSYAFNKARLAEFTFPESLETIGGHAFEDATIVSEHDLVLRFPASVRELGREAFSNFDCTKNIKEVDLQNTLITTIPVEAFYDADIKSILLPSGVESIGSSAFYHTFIEEINLPSSLTDIGDFAFGATWLTRISIPSSVKTIGNGFVSDKKVILEVAPGSYAETWATENGYMIAKQGGDDTSWLNYD